MRYVKWKLGVLGADPSKPELVGVESDGGGVKIEVDDGPGCDARPRIDKDCTGCDIGCVAFRPSGGAGIDTGVGVTAGGNGGGALTVIACLISRSTS